MFLRNSRSTTCIRPAPADSFAFLLDMNRLFEDFVTSSSRDVSRDRCPRSPAGARPNAHHEPHRSAVRGGDPGHPPRATPGPSAPRPGRREVQAVRREKIDQSDIYQTFFYAWAYADRDVDQDARAFILYPASGGTAGDMLNAKTSAGSIGATIRAIPIDVPAALDAVRAQLPVPIPALTEAFAE